MKRKRFSVEHIVAVLQQAEMGAPVADLIRHLGIAEQTLRQECLNAHWFESLRDAQACIEAWRREYNESRHHRALQDRTPEEYLPRGLRRNGSASLGSPLDTLPRNGTEIDGWAAC